MSNENSICFAMEIFLNPWINEIPRPTRCTFSRNKISMTNAIDCAAMTTFKLLLVLGGIFTDCDGGKQGRK